MSTTENPIPADDMNRRVWFIVFGYDGDLTEEVILREANGRSLGTG